MTFFVGRTLGASNMTPRIIQIGTYALGSQDERQICYFRDYEAVALA